MRGIHTTDDLEAFFMSHGERIVDTLGEELDRIEQDLKVPVIVPWLVMFNYS